MEPAKAVFVFVAALGVLASPASSGAQLRCGDRISSGQEIVLGEHLACDGDGGAAVVVTGPAVLDLNGFTISCADLDGDGRTARVGIALLGWSVTVRNGTLNECHHGVVAAGQGFHRIDRVSTLFGTGDGLVLGSDANRVQGALAFFHGGAGIVLRGSSSAVSDSTATGNRVGFRVEARSSVVRSVATASERDGFLIAGAGSELADNRALGGLVGFTVVGTSNQLLRNESRQNVVGIYLDARASSNAVVGNVASENTVAGIDARGARDLLLLNRTENNRGHGIRVPAGADALGIGGTLARGNGVADLTDEEPGCGGNRWRANRFETSNQPCIE